MSSSPHSQPLQPPADQPADLADLQARQVRKWPRAVAAFVLGLFLMAIAIRVVLGERATLHAGLSALGRAPAWMIAAALILPMLNLTFASGSFWVLTNRYGRVRYREMFGLIGSAWLLNHLPLRPGMIGRVAYHKLVHGISIRASLAVLLSALICAAVGMALLLAITIVLHALGSSTAVWVGVLLLPVLIGMATALYMHRRASADSSRGQFWRFPAAIVFRYLDVCCWTARYALVFALIGRPVSADAAAAVALSSQAAMLSPIQLGLREWMVALAASIVTRSEGAHADTLIPDRSVPLPESLNALAPGLLADIINRSAELSVAIPVGVVATLLLLARYRRAQRLADSANPAARQAL